MKFIRLAFLIFGVAAFMQISQWGKVWEYRNSQVEAGLVEATQGVVVRKWDEKSTSRRNGKTISEHKYYVNISIADGAGRERRTLPYRDWKEIKEGLAIKAYPFEDDYFIPRFDQGGHQKGKWIFLGVGLAPSLLYLLSRIK
jgi:hypothetical protein